MTARDEARGGGVDADEVARFGRLAAEWWNPRGPYGPLHRLNPTRIAYLRDQIAAQYGRAGPGMRPLAGLAVLDVGCGGGLLCEPLTRLGAMVTGIDPAAESITVARAHAEEAELAVAYRQAVAEDLAAEGAGFDAVIASEVIEHVPDPSGFVRTLAALARPGGLVLISTIDRTLKSLALAKIGAEYVLRWLPRGTHDWRRFVTPEELERHARAAGLEVVDLAGMIYDPLRDAWRLGEDTGVNYWMTLGKPKAGS